MAVRIVTLDRAEALGQLDVINTSDSRGIAKVRVETPRPLLAIVLRLGETNPAISAALAWSPVPISIAVSSTHPDIEDLEQSAGGLDEPVECGNCNAATLSAHAIRGSG